MKNSGTKREFESDEDCMDHELAQPDKKRRLRSEQVKWLERSFEAERKLEPERKVKLAIELGLYPRQVAIWFQNHRARWKTKQLERDFNSLQSAYDDLKQHHKAVKCDNETLIEQIGEIKAKMVRDAPLGLSFNCETNVGSSDNEEVSMHYDIVSSCGIPINEGAWSQEIWPHPYSFLAAEEPRPMFNWYCPDPWN